MPLTRTEVYCLYKGVLGREPESEAAYTLHMAAHPNYETARIVFMNTREFQDQVYPPIRYQPVVAATSGAKPHALALAAIVKNEERNIELMIRSALPIVSFVAIADTGSSDGTMQIANRLLKEEGVLHSVEKIDFHSFSQARNQALELVPTAMSWTLMLDADEHLVPEDYLLFADLMKSDCDAWALPRYSFSDQNKAGPIFSYPDHQRRLVRNRPDNPVRFTGSVHENIVEPFVVEHAPADTTRFAGSRGGPHIHHMGGVDVSEDRIREKLDFYVKLASEAA